MLPFENALISPRTFINSLFLISLPVSAPARVKEYTVPGGRVKVEEYDDGSTRKTSTYTSGDVNNVHHVQEHTVTRRFDLGDASYSPSLRPSLRAAGPSSVPPDFDLSELTQLPEVFKMLNASPAEKDDKKYVTGNEARPAIKAVPAKPAAVQKLKHSENSNIMISYCHKQKHVSQKLLKELRNSGVENIWIDQEHMHKGGGILDEMVKAVDSSQYVICCISRDYSKSDNCMGEMKYARDKKKTIIPVVAEKGYVPDQILLMCIGDKFRFDLSTDEQFRVNYPLLLEKLTD